MKILHSLVSFVFVLNILYCQDAETLTSKVPVSIVAAPEQQTNSTMVDRQKTYPTDVIYGLADVQVAEERSGAHWRKSCINIIIGIFLTILLTAISIIFIRIRRRLHHNN